MLGLAVIVIALIYFIFLIWATLKTYRVLKAKGKTKVRALSGAALVFVVIVLVVFWDTIPTQRAHDYYCKNEAGFFQYKTLEQWKAENPGVWETLRFYPDAEQSKQREFRWLNGIRYSAQPVNARFFIYSNSQTRYMNGNIAQREKLFYDESTGEVLARAVEFSTGPGNSLEAGGGYKIWLNEPTCGNVSVILQLSREFSNMELSNKPQ